MFLAIINDTYSEVKADLEEARYLKIKEVPDIRHPLILPDIRQNCLYIMDPVRADSAIDHDIEKEQNWIKKCEKMKMQN